MHADAVAGLVRGQFIGLMGIIGVVVMAGLLSQWRYWSRPVPSGVARSATLADNSAAALSKARAAIEKAWLGVIEWGQDWTQQEDLLGNCEELGAIGRDLSVRHTRLRVTFGPDDEATVSFGEAVEAAEEVCRALEDMRGQSTRSPPGGCRAEGQAGRDFEADRKKIDSERRRFLATSARFEAAIRRSGEGAGTPD